MRLLFVKELSALRASPHRKHEIGSNDRYHRENPDDKVQEPFYLHEFIVSACSECCNLKKGPNVNWEPALNRIIQIFTPNSEQMTTMIRVPIITMVRSEYALQSDIEVVHSAYY